MAAAVPQHEQARMQVKPLTLQDVSAYRRLMLHAYVHAADAFTSTAEERAAEPDSWWEKRIADSRGAGLAFGAFRDADLVGSVALGFSCKPKTRHQALVVGMYVLDHARGSGLGRALLHTAIAHARARGDIKTLTLTVTEGNEPAVTLYRHAGFEVFGTEPMAILTPAGFKAKLHMWRRLE